MAEAKKDGKPGRNGAFCDTEKKGNCFHALIIYGYNQTRRVYTLQLP
jgi:hypothetical protein